MGTERAAAQHRGVPGSILVGSKEVARRYRPREREGSNDSGRAGTSTSKGQHRLSLVGRRRAGVARIGFGRAGIARIARLGCRAGVAGIDQLGRRTGVAGIALGRCTRVALGRACRDLNRGIDRIRTSDRKDGRAGGQGSDAERQNRFPNHSSPPRVMPCRRVRRPRAPKHGKRTWQRSCRRQHA